MDAQEWKMLISAYADGEVTPEESVAAERLLAERPECRAYLNELRKLTSSLTVLKDESLSPDADMKILSTTKESSMKTNNWRIPATVTVTVLVAVLAYTNTNMYVKRGLQGRMKSATDDIGEQYSQSQAANYHRTSQAVVAKTVQWSPSSGVKKDGGEAYRGRAKGGAVQVAQLAGAVLAAPAMQRVSADRSLSGTSNMPVQEAALFGYSRALPSVMTYEGKYRESTVDLRYQPYPNVQYPPDNTEEYAKF